MFTTELHTHTRRGGAMTNKICYSLLINILREYIQGVLKKMFHLGISAWAELPQSELFSDLIRAVFGRVGL